MADQSHSEGRDRFQFYFLRNYSTVKEDEFVVWELGPQAILAWKF